MDRGQTGRRYDILDRMLLDENADATDLPLSLLQDITKDFSADREIGRGGFAVVYKGFLKNGVVAVKKLNATLNIDEKKFNQEVQCLRKMKHKNVVRFLGFCADSHGRIEEYNGKSIIAGEESRLLCFEYVPNGSLEKHMNYTSPRLEWRDWYQIIKGICEALDYLHKKHIVHLDLKPANILIDDCMVPKIADFGISRCFDENQTKTFTSNLIGSPGYLAPESFMSVNSNRVITYKSDIYSLGVIISQIVTREKWFSTIEDDTQLKQVRACTEIWKDCVEFDPKKRPDTKHIMEMLNKTGSADSSVETSMNSSSLVKDVTSSSVNPKELEAEGKPQTSLDDKQMENQNLLIKCVSQDIGFSSGRPIAACLIYRCFLHWRSFEVERTSVFNRIIQTILNAIERQDLIFISFPKKKGEVNNDKLAYWLSNSSTLLLLLQRTLKASGAAGLTRRRQRPSATLLGRFLEGIQASLQSDGHPFLGSRLSGGLVDGQVEAKFPALLFKQQLTACLEKIYGMVRDNLKKDISPLLVLCIQAPRKFSASRSQRIALFQQTPSAHWQSIVKILTNYMDVLKANYVPSLLVRKVFTQIFSFINVQLFNSLLLRRECCSFSNGEYIKAGLAELNQWCIYVIEEYKDHFWGELKHIRQGVEFLVIPAKRNLTLKDITDLCPVLSVHQLYRIATMYWDDIYGTHSVSGDVIASMRTIMSEDSSNLVSSSFLLDDDSSIPFSIDDMAKSIPEIKVTDVELPWLIRENWCSDIDNTSYLLTVDT